MATGVSTVRQYPCENGIITVDLRNVPILSEWTKSTFEKLELQCPSLFKEPSRLLERYGDIEWISQKLANTNRRNLCAMFKTVLSVGVVVGTVFFFDKVRKENAGIILGKIGAVLAHAWLSGILYCRGVLSINGIEKKSPNQPSRAWRMPRRIYEVLYMAMGLGTLMPIYQAFTRATRLKRVSQELGESVQTELAACDQHNRVHLQNVFHFSPEGANALLRNLEDKKVWVQNCRASIAGMPNWIKYSNIMNDGAAYELIQGIEHAQEEVKKVQAFYQQTIRSGDKE